MTDESINENKYEIRYNVLFPYLENKLKYNDLKIDKESINLISTCNQSCIITNIMKTYMYNVDLNPADVIITDMTAGVGGNAIHFGLNFKYVNAIELDTLRATYLENNKNVYGLTNISIFNDDSINAILDLMHDVIFIDPPWGGADYKNASLIRLKLGFVNIEDLINLITYGVINKHIPKLIVLKLPKNYDMDHFKNNVIYNDIKIDMLHKIMLVTLFI